MKPVLRFINALILLVAIGGCGSKESDIVGTWTTDLNSGPNKFDRFTFHADGKTVWRWHQKDFASTERSNDYEQSGSYKVNGLKIELDLGPRYASNHLFKQGSAEKGTASITWVSRDVLDFTYSKGTFRLYRVHVQPE